MKSIKVFLLIAFSGLVFTGCDTEVEALDVQKLFEYDEQYYANLRAYKKSDHTVFFGWYAAYAPLEGVSGYKDPASWGERILGLPDSLDVVSLWMGIPGNDPSDPDSYAPVAYSDWKFVREKKGTRFVATNIVRLNKEITLKNPITLTYGEGSEATVISFERGEVVNLKKTVDGGYVWREGTSNNNTDNINDTIRVDIYTEWLIDQVRENDLDGIDFDYEPEGDRIQGSLFTRMVQRASKYFGPMSDPALNPEGKILCIDFYSTTPPTACGQYATYYIRQAYTQGFTEHSATRLQGYYNTVAGAVPPEKFIVTEQLSVFYQNAGSPFTEADGNTLSDDGMRMYSLEGMARWNPTQGRKGGFGGFYFDRDYYHPKGPYYNVRRAIQKANPAVR